MEGSLTILDVDLAHRFGPLMWSAIREDSGEFFRVTLPMERWAQPKTTCPFCWQAVSSHPTAVQVKAKRTVCSKRLWSWAWCSHPLCESWHMDDGHLFMRGTVLSLLNPEQ